MNYEITENTQVHTDLGAEELILDLKEKYEEFSRLKDVCELKIQGYMEMISEYDRQYDELMKLYHGILGRYCLDRSENGHAKATKTTVSYALPSGKLVWKKQKPMFQRDANALLEYAKKYRPEYVKEKLVESVDWETMKEKVEIIGETVAFVSADGEVFPVDGVQVVERPDVFEIV
jgi:hypothetical protein